jgi:hypothetical protein
VLVDFAKAIVGHTTTDSVTLFFRVHGTVRPEHHYVCEIAPAAAPAGPVIQQPLESGPTGPTTP